MNKPSYLLILAGVLSFCAAIFQAVIAFVPEWSAAPVADARPIGGACVGDL